MMLYIDQIIIYDRHQYSKSAFSKLFQEKDFKPGRTPMKWKLPGFIVKRDQIL